MTTSISVPRMTKIARPAARGANTDPPLSHAAPRTAVTAPATKATVSRSATAKRSPRFQASENPKGATKQAVNSSAPQVRLKNGAPTVIFSPVNCSSASG